MILQKIKGKACKIPTEIGTFSTKMLKIKPKIYLTKFSKHYFFEKKILTMIFKMLKTRILVAKYVKSRSPLIVKKHGSGKMRFI